MQYFGGKQRIAKKIVEYLSQYKDLPYVEPFVGSGAILSLIPNIDRLACDINTSLIMLLKEVSEGTFSFPENLSEDEYKVLKDDPKPSAMKAFAGFGCSFGGKWFGGYARDPKSDRNYARAASNGLKIKAKGMKGTLFQCVSYHQIALEYEKEPHLVYCDPPYKGTTKLYNGEFHTAKFWEVMREWSKRHVVIVSEYEAPDDFTCVLEIPTRTDMKGKDNKMIPRTEKLFRYKDSI